jgi:zinc protease
VVAGDIDKAETKVQVAKYFGALAKGAPADVRTAPVPVTVMSERRLAVEADVELARVQITWPTPPSFAPGDGDLDAAAAVLSRGKSSRLYKRLVYELQIAQDVSVYQAPSQLASTFNISATIKKGKDPLKVLAIIDAELDALRKVPVADAELERVRPGLLSGLVFPLESVSTRAEVLNRYNQLAGDPGYLDKDLARYRALTSRSVSEAIVKYLHPKNRIVTIVTPTKGAPRAGRLAGGAS